MTRIEVLRQKDSVQKDAMKNESGQIAQPLCRYYFAGRYIFGKKVLDLSCGRGDGSAVLAAGFASEVVGVDENREKIRYAQEHIARPNLRFEHAQLCRLPFEDDSFDVIVSIDAHVEGLYRNIFWREVGRAANQDSIIIVSAEVDSENSGAPGGAYDIEEWRYYCDNVAVYVDYFIQSDQEFLPWDGSRPGCVIAVCRGVRKLFARYTEFDSKKGPGKRVHIVDGIKYVEKEDDMSYDAVFPDDEKVSIQSTQTNVYTDINGPQGLRRYKHLGPYVSADTTVLDCGCSSGYGARYLAECGARVTGMDVDPVCINYGVKRYGDVQFLVGESDRLPFVDDSFDIVACIDSASCISEGKKFINQVCRVLKPGGLALFTTDVTVANNPRRIWLNALGKYFPRKLWHWIADDGKRFEIICRKEGENKKIECAPFVVSRNIPQDEKIYLNDYDKLNIKRNVDDSFLIDSHVGRYRFASQFAQGKNILDCGCGSGYGTAILGRHAQKAAGVDIDEEALEYAQKYYEEGNTVFLRGDLDMLGAEGGKKYDLVTCFEVINRLDDPRLFLNDVVGRTASGGMLLVNIPCSDISGSKFIKRQYSINEMFALLRNYFKFVCCYYQEGANISETPAACAQSVIFVCIAPLDAKLDPAINFKRVVQAGIKAHGAQILPVNIDYIRQRLFGPPVPEKLDKGKVLVFHHPVPVYNNPYICHVRYQQYFVLGEQLRRLGWDVSYFCSDEIKRYFSDDNSVSPSDYGGRPGVSDWALMYRNMMLGQVNGAEIKQWRNIYEKAIDEIKPDVVFTWNVDGTLKQITDERDILLINNEVSVLRDPYPQSYFYDPSGVAAGSSIKRLWKDKYSHEPMGDDRVGLVQRLRDHMLSNIKVFSDMDRIKARLGLSGKKLALVLLQVENDSNIIAYSPFESMLEFLGAFLPQIVDEYDVIIKRHPCEISKQDFESADPGGNVKFVDDEFSVLELANVSDCVFTINSTGGFEALMLHKRVIAFGESFYSGLGMTIDIKEEILDQNKLASPELTDDEKALIDRFVYFMIFQYSVFDDVMWDPELQSELIEEWISLRKENAPLTSFLGAVHSASPVGAKSRCERLIEGHNKNMLLKLEQASMELQRRERVNERERFAGYRQRKLDEKERFINSVMESLPFRLLGRIAKMRGKSVK
jgi:ubiquinone/menaquinone biosynthesis C-methylase UbiE